MPALDSLGRLAAGSPPSATSAITRFMLGSLAAIAVVVVGGFFALRSVTVREAERDTRQRVELQGAVVESAGLGDGVLRGDARALARLDDVVAGRVLSPSVVRVKIWSRDGRVLYSDEPAIVGRRFSLGAEDLALFTKGGADAELSDLSKPENRYERQEGKLLEAHTVIRTPNGTPVLFETYQRFEALSASGHRLLRTLTPTLLAALAVLLLFQVPLAWSLVGCSAGTATASGCCCARSRRRIVSDGASRPTSTTASCRISPVSRSASPRSPMTRRAAAPAPRPRCCARAPDACATGCVLCARCSSRSIRRASSRPVWRRR
jgi:hypothetical protein